ncbi:hypothetical protein [Naasia lichenicola]|uniref:DUF8094 domain-containing protein n=1 Tax=Naasia lichenicola TaxID=2565933 RepID=A0A4S4FQ36_9MICO|nr:hypothetical protein [Naasia lichenicola]THG31715.1 hypothetical protein E6C64_06520 [Naasia lichenicola]
MRFVFAIVAFVIAAGMIAYGIAQRTVLAPDDRVVAVAEFDSTTAFTVVDGSVLAANPGQQRLDLAGTGPIFAAYARTADIQAWLGDTPYNEVGYDVQSGRLDTTVVTNTDTNTDTATDTATGEASTATTPAPNPAGSDLWLEERTGESQLRWTVDLPSELSLIIASDGAAPAPSALRLSWPVVHSTPWAGPLIIGGGVLLIIGLILYVWGLVHMRRTRGPRRKAPPKMPRLPQPPKYKPQNVLEPATTAKGRRSARRVGALAGGLILTTLALSGCSAVDDLFADQPVPSPSPSSTDVPLDDALPVAVTVSQLDRIIDDVVAVSTDADANRNGDLLASRFAGPALEERLANYAERGADGAIAPPEAIAAGKIKVDLPEATDTWPRTVFAVVGTEDPAVAPVALVLMQQTPRDKYLVNYAVKLQPGIEFPAVAPPTVGTASLPGDAKFFVTQPDQVGAQYADILLNGEASASFPLFQADPDGLRTQVGVDYKNGQRAALPTTASIEYANGPGSGPVVTLATNEVGAIIATSIVETETVKPVETGATVSPTGAVKALSGLTSTEKGVVSTYGYQLLFFVPPAIDGGQVQLLGYAQALISAKEL